MVRRDVAAWSVPAEPCAIVGLCWPHTDHAQLLRHGDCVRSEGQGIRRRNQSPYMPASAIDKFLAGTGMRDVTVRPIDIPGAFESFDDYWTPILGGAGSAPKYCASLSEEARGHLREVLGKRLPAGPDGGTPPRRTSVGCKRAGAGTGVKVDLLGSAIPCGSAQADSVRVILWAECPKHSLLAESPNASPDLGNRVECQTFTGPSPPCLNDIIFED